MSLAAGAAASIATSLPSFDRSTTIDLPSLVLAPQPIMQKVHLHAEVTLPKKADAEMTVFVVLTLRPRTADAEVIELSLATVGVPDPEGSVDKVLDTRNGISESIGKAAPDCEWPTCVRDFELTIRRHPGDNAPDIDVTGTAELQVFGTADSPDNTKIQDGATLQLTAEIEP